MKSFFNSTSFPLRSSLFFRWKDGNYYSTWALLCQGWRDGAVNDAIAKMAEYDVNFLTYYVFHMGDPHCLVNPFKGNPTASKIVAHGGWEVDMAEVMRWLGILTPGMLPSIFLGPSLFCGDDAATTNCPEFHAYYVPAVVQVLRPYSKFICTGSELPKSMNRAQRTALVGLVKRSLAIGDQALLRAGVEPYLLPVVEHLQGDEVRYVADNADAVLYQFSFHPRAGHERSVEAILREYERAQSMCPKPLLPFEMSLQCEHARAREQARALMARGAAMVPGPV